MQLSRQNFHNYAYFVSLIIIAISLPYSKFSLSIGVILLVINWLLSFQWKKKWAMFKKNSAVLFFVIFYLVHLAGILYSTDKSFAFNQLRIKMPLLFLPVVMATTEKIQPLAIKSILLLFVAAVFSNTLISSAYIFNFLPVKISDYRDASLFISHIRFSLMLLLALSIIWYFFRKEKTCIPLRMVYFIVFLWLIFYLFLFKVLTGIFLFFILLFSIIVREIILCNSMVKKTYILCGAILLLLAISFMLWNFWQRYNKTYDDTLPLESHSPSGHFYYHDTTSKIRENGYYVWRYYCEPEMAAAWARRSKIHIDSLDAKGQYIRYTLIRYLTSKGLRKDSSGIAQLSDTDVSLVEAGCPNHIFSSTMALYPRFYELFWQIDCYVNGQQPSGHSVTLRIVYLKTALRIIREHFWTGVGTGDLQLAFNKEYEKSYPLLEQRYRLRAHNQFVTLMVAFGLPLGLLLIVCLVVPAWQKKAFSSFLFFCFFVIGFGSMLNEDTLETHIGVCFFAFFYALLLYASGDDEQKLKEGVVIQGS